jgi:hypothetical protein
MKKLNSLLILTMLVSLFANCQNKTSMDKVTRVEIRSVNFSLMTVISVKCENFEKYFTDYKETILTDSVQIATLLSHFNDLERTDSTYSTSIDTRAKIKLITNKDTTLICVGNLSLLKDNVHYKTPDSLIELIDNY